MRPMDLYYAATPNGWKISIALEEMNIPYNLKMVNLMKGDQRTPEFLKLSPNGRMPALVDYEPFPGEAKELTIFESGAILQHLAEKTGKFIPKDKYEKSLVMQWVFWQMGGLGPMAGQLSHFINYAPHLTKSDTTYSLNRYRNEYKRLLSVIESQLAKHAHIAHEDYTIADMASYPWVVPAKRFGVSLDDYPRTKAWAAVLASRPAVYKGLRVGKTAITTRKPSDPLNKDMVKNLFQASKM
eukprot:TRINITY_DN6882_c0_g1_i1.p1 TRINITY_DN6882_c0_g1~~TRINITY_DN6882_c0_g1_i1.p1  ORF type:complete len:241 (+),score=45.66 TRINITY_DN6882_c0_g1_i1:43-765(+)